MSEVPEVKTIGEVERIVHGSAQWDGTSPVVFSNDGETWTEAWSPTEDHPNPEFARVTVYRKDVRLPADVTIRWAEQYPAASEEWSGKWDRSPMRHFGRTARMVAFRQIFRDLLGDIRIEDEADDRVGASEPASDPWETPARDWAAEIESATTIDAIDAIEKDGRAVRIFTPDPEGTALHRALKTRQRELVAEALADEPISAEQESVAPARPHRPAARDYLPSQNRAQRRKAARRKDRR